MNDCVICVVAMVTGYSYEQVLKDSEHYTKHDAEGKFEWWVEYIQHEGRTVQRSPFIEAFNLWKSPRRTVGILGMDIPHLKRAHVAAVDAAGVVDPADGFPDHLHLADYCAHRLQDGFVLHADFLAIHWG